MKFNPEENEEMGMEAEMPMDNDVLAQLDVLANDYPKLKKDIDSLKKKIEDEMPEMDEEMEDAEDDFDPAEDEEMDDMSYDDEDLDSILG